MIICKLAETPQDIKKAFEVRRRVFVEEQKVPAEMEVDEFDEKAVHVIANEGNRIVGTGRLVIEEDKGRIGRVAVEQEARGMGVGRAIMIKLEEEARKRKLGEIYLHAQTHAQKFYENLGFIPRGEVFDEAGIEHQEMFILL